MTDTTPNLALPELIAAQAQKHVTVNEALRALDVLVQLAVLDRDLATPPGSPDEGERWLIAASPTGDWAGHAGDIAAWQDGGWEFYAPQIGWLAYVIDEAVLLAWTGTTWVDAISAINSLNNMTLLGVGTTADATNPFSAKLNNVLWVAKAISEGGDGDLRWKMSKESAGGTLSMLLQTAYSGRAEIGLTGDDDMHMKVSPDGTIWLDALTVDRATGKVSLGQGFQSPVAARAQLAAAPFDALAFNGMQINGNVGASQELGTTGATLVNNTQKYIADMWQAKCNHAAATAVVTSAQVALTGGLTLPGYAFGHQIKATTAFSSPADGDLAWHRTFVEGYRFARMAWGTASAQPVAYAFWFYSTVSGVAFIKFSNAAGNRLYYKEFSVAAGWNWVSDSIPGDTSGTWETTTSIGLMATIFSGGGATSPVAPGSWTTTNVSKTTNSTNLLGTNNNLTVVTGFILLPGIELPSSDRAALIMRPYPDTLDECKRYLEITTQRMLIGLASTATALRCSVQYAKLKRTTPAVTLLTTTPSVVCATTTFAGSGSALVSSGATDAGGIISINGFTGMTAGAAFSGSAANADIFMNDARM